MTIDLDGSICTHVTYDSQSLCDNGAFPLGRKHFSLLRTTEAMVSLPLKQLKGEFEGSQIVGFAGSTFSRSSRNTFKVIALTP
jgi:hypothetical protein